MQFWSQHIAYFGGVDIQIVGFILMNTICYSYIWEHLPFTLSLVETSPPNRVPVVHLLFDPTFMFCIIHF